MTATAQRPTEEVIEPIRTPRLTLVSMSVPFMEALVAGELGSAAVEMGAVVPLWLVGQLDHFLQFRLAQLAVDPPIRPWLGRGIVLDDEHGARRVIGSIGFHGPPDEKGRLEIGYSIDPPYRRQGYAREAIRAMFDWAYATHSITRFVASISPENEPSLKLAESFGFVKVGEQMDDVDGLEYAFETTWPAPFGSSQGSNS